MLSPSDRQQIMDAIDDALRSRPQAFTPERQDQLDTVSAQMATLQQDPTIGRMPNDRNLLIGKPGGSRLQWVDGALTVFFGANGLDYLGNDILHFDVSGSPGAVITMQNGSTGRLAMIIGQSDVTGSQILLRTLGDASNRKTELFLSGTNGSTTQTGYFWAYNDSGLATGLQIGSDGTCELLVLGTAALKLTTGNAVMGSGRGFVLPTKAGTPADGDFTSPVNGLIALDTTNNLLYFRSTTWQLAGGGVTGFGASGYPVDVQASTEADGTATTVARSDHQHKVGFLTTKGDILTHSTVPARLAVGGTLGQVLTVDAGDANGILWSPEVRKASTAATISAGVATVTNAANYWAFNGQGSAADDLDSISGVFPAGCVLYAGMNGAGTITFKDGTGNLNLAGDFVADNVADVITLVSTGSAWREVARSNNA